ncbi:hypothetical protein GCM10022214_69700 [Actinomadura miaoliensis]|uniref:Uncharacterized protein n=1 Tax=Actinomadura miaoliensis TaxID=430685 RepID=A0ABP7WTX3_9ACTN
MPVPPSGPAERKARFPQHNLANQRTATASADSPSASRGATRNTTTWHRVPHGAPLSARFESVDLTGCSTSQIAAATARCPLGGVRTARRPDRGLDQHRHAAEVLRRGVCLVGGSWRDLDPLFGVEAGGAAAGWFLAGG